VVKELLENAIDARARRVQVEVRDGGRSFLAVSDDGAGMSVEDATLAVERHATSKVSEFEDLQALTTYGFRGEALPAIASVSRFRLRTRLHGASEGFLIEIDHGRLVEARPDGCPEGTRIEVAELFGDIPARRKFLKTAGTEWGHIADFLSRAALGLPDVHIDVLREGRGVFQWPAVSDPTDRVAAVLSDRDAESLLPTDASREGLRVSGYVSRPDVHRANGSAIYAFVNGRPVRDRLLRHAVIEGYRDWLPKGRYPVAVLFVDAPLDAVDVNVHPAKWEVRFADPQAVHGLIRHALRQTMADRGFLRSRGEGAAADPGPGAGRSFQGASPLGEAGATSDWILAERPETAPASVSGAPVAASVAEVEGGPPPARFLFGELRCIGQLHETYLLVEDAGALLLVDQHAAHERVLYEELRSKWIERKTEKQVLLLPVTVEMDASAVAGLAEHAETLDRMGFEVEAFSDDSVIVRAIPGLLGERDPARLVRRLGDALIHRELQRDELALLRELEPMDRVFATLACHASTRAGDHLERAQQQALLHSLDSVPWAPTCPHGRPVAVPIDRGEIERRFARR